MSDKEEILFLRRFQNVIDDGRVIVNSTFMPTKAPKIWTRTEAKAIIVKVPIS